MQWQPQTLVSASRRLMDADTTQGLQMEMRNVWAKVWAEPDTPSIGAYIARSYSGDETQLWLNGFVETADDDVFAFVILLEDRQDIPQLLSIGRDLFEIFARPQ